MNTLLNKLFPNSRYETYTISPASFPSWPEWVTDYVVNQDNQEYQWGNVYILDKETGIVVKKDKSDDND